MKRRIEIKSVIEKTHNSKDTYFIVELKLRNIFQRIFGLSTTVKFIFDYRPASYGLQDSIYTYPDLQPIHLCYGSEERESICKILISAVSKYHFEKRVLGDGFAEISNLGK